MASYTEFFNTPVQTQANTASYNDFFQSTPVPQPTKKPFSERKGIVQTLFAAPLNLGKTLFELTPTARALQQSLLRAENLAVQLQHSDMDTRRKQLALNTLADLPTFEEVIEPRSNKEVIGDILGTALWTIPVGNLVKGGTIAAHLGRGAITGGAFGFADGLSDDADTGELFKSVAIGAALGAPLEVGGALAIKGASKAAQGVKNLFKKGLDVNPRFFMSISRRLEKDFGTEGKQIAERLLTADRNHVLRAGTELDTLYKAGLGNLDDETAVKLANALEGRQPVEDSFRTVFNAVDDLRKRVGKEAQEKGFMVKLKKGVEVPFQGRENYFPHYMPSIERMQKERVRQELINTAVINGKVGTKAEAEKLYDSFLEVIAKNGKGGKFWAEFLVKDGQAKTMNEAIGKTMRFFRRSRLQRSGSLESARELNVPWYDIDPRRVIPRYVMSATQRLEEVPLFGREFEKIDSLLGQIRNTQGQEAGDKVRYLVKVARKSWEYAPGHEKVSLFLRTLQIPKLAYAQVSNASQSLNTILATDLKSFGKGIAYSLTKGGRSRALQSGATLESVLRQSHESAGIGSELGEKFLKFTGFSSVEKANRVVAANTGFEYTRSQFKKLLKKPTNPIFRERLTELGINVEEALKRGTPTQSELLMAAQRIAETTQFRGRILDLPAFMASPEGKIVGQFRSFAFQQTKFLKNQFKSELTRGNYSKVARDLLVLSTIFPMTGEVIADIRSLLTGTKRPTDFFDRYIEDVTQVGGLGIVADSLTSANYGRLLEFFAGPTITSLAQLGERGMSVVKKRKLNESDVKYLLNQTGVLRPIANYAFPNSKKDQETFLETLKALYEEFN